MKQCVENPWLKFAENNRLGDKVKGEVSSLSDFGMFVSLDGGIDGLIHLSDLSWTESEQEAVKNYSKGQSIEAVILAMDAHKERISMGIKQLTEDFFETFAADNPKGTQVEAFFRDGDDGQEPQMMATLPAIPKKGGDKKGGPFMDNRWRV